MLRVGGGGGARICRDLGACWTGLWSAGAGREVGRVGGAFDAGGLEDSRLSTCRVGGDLGVGAGVGRLGVEV